MKLKRFLALVVSLAMVLSVVPAFSLTASAATTYTSEELVSMASYTFDGSYSAGGVSGTQDGDGNITIQTITSPTQWSGWSSSWGGSNVTDGSGTNVNMLNTGSQNVIQVYGANVSDSSKGATVTASDAVQTGTADTDYLILDFAITGSSGNEHDYGIYDVDGTLIDSFRHLSGAIGPFYADNAGGAASFGSGQMFTGLSYTYDNGYWWDVKGTRIRLVFANDEDGDGYTVQYCYTSDGSTYSVSTTKTYATGTVNGFSKFVAAPCNGSGGWWTNTKIIDPKIYAGNYPAATKTIVAIYTAGGTTVKTQTKTIDTSVTDSASFDAYYYSVNGTNTLYYAAAQTLTDSATIEMTALSNANVLDSEYITVGNTIYHVTSDNLVPNGDFAYGLTGWYGCDYSAASNFTVNGDGTVTSNTSSGAGSANSLHRAWAIEDGKTYMFTLYDSADHGYHAFSLTDTIGTETSVLLGTNAGASENNGIGTTYHVFTNDGGYDYAQIKYRWTTNTFGNFGLYEVEVAESYTITLNITGTDGSTVKTLASAALSGGSVSFDAQSFTANGVFYTTDAVTYSNITADATYTLVATADTTKIATTNNFSYNFYTGENVWAGDNGFSSADMSGTISIGWNNFRQTVMTFPLTYESGTLISAIDLHVNVGYASPSSASYTVYAIDPSYVGDGTMDPAITGYAYSDLATVVSNLGGVQVGSATVSAGENTITLDLSSAGSITGDGTLALLITSSNQVYTYSATTAYPPYLSSTYETISAITYTVNYVDESGNTLADATTVDYAPGTQYGYDDEVICPNLSIPTISGYLFKSKSISGSTITLTYAVDSQDDYFFDNITDMDTRFVSLNMLGSHDAFTSGVSEIRYDAAGVAQDNDSAKGATIILGSTVAASKSKAQSLTALGQLQAGARYFDIRLSRSETDYDAGTLYNNAPHTNGVIYTTHGLLFDEFEPALYSIAQWAATHPGEVIVLDIQEYFDYNSGYDGNATAQSWRDLNSLLSSTGILEYVTVGNGSIKNITYGDLTENGTKASIVLFGRAVATNAGVGNFILRGDMDGAFNGKVYSNYETGLSTTIGSSYDADYIQAQVDYAKTYQSVTGDTSGDEIVHWMFRVMQAQSEATNLLNQAPSDNTSLLADLQANPEWLTYLPVVMVNGVGSNTDDIVTLLKSCNVPSVTVNYVNNGTTVYSEVGGLVGTLYTNDGFYSTPWYKIVNNTSGEYYVSETFYTAPASGTITPVLYGGSVDIDVTALGNVYTTRLIDGVHCVLTANLTDDGTYTGIDNFGAFTWGNDHDRIGIAVLDATAGANAYMLTGTEARKYFNSDAGVTYFYAVPAATYRALDLTNKDNLTALLTTENLVGTLTHGNCSEAATGTLNLVLDSDKMATAAASGEVVIIGDSISGLYGLAGSDVAIVSGNLVDVNGSQTVVVDGATYTLGDSKVYEDAEGNIYTGASSVTVNGNMEFTGYDTLGVDMVMGAQVRIGSGVDDEGKVSTGSGLRFITTINRGDTIAGLDKITEYGVLLMAEDSDVTKEIPAASWQDGDAKTVFTTAITNLAVSNYNREFTAYPYIKYTDAVSGETKTVVGEGVTRSIYQVAAGLLANETDGTEYDDEALASKVLYDVLNAYVNQVGIRLTLTDTDGGKTYNEGDTLTARVEEGLSGAYTGNAFFEVGDTTFADGKFTVTLTPVGEKTVIKTNTIESVKDEAGVEFYKEYVRINNNNSAIYAAVDVAYDEETNTYTLTFDTNSLN